MKKQRTSKMLQDHKSEHGNKMFSVIRKLLMLKKYQAIQPDLTAGQAAGSQADVSSDK